MTYMTDRSRRTLLLVLSCLILAFLMEAPQLLHMMDDRWRGIPVTINSDEQVYRARVEEALSGRPEQTAEAFVGNPELVGTQFALIERVYGTLFSWTDLRAAQVLQIEDAVVPVIVFLLIFTFLRLCGFGFITSFSGAVLFCLLQLYNLNRPIHMRSSFAMMLAGLVSVLLALRGSKLFTVLAGLILGTLVGVYLWSWTFAWSWLAIYLGWEIIEWLFESQHHGWMAKWLHGLLRRTNREKTAEQHWRRLLLIAIIGAVCAIPALWGLWSMMQHPLYEYGSFRSGMHPGRLPESIPYSILFITMVVGVGMTLWRHYDDLRPFRPAIVTLFAAFVVIHQQAVHGIVFNFVSHSIFSLALAAICVLLLTEALRTRWLLLAALAAAVYLGAIGYDGRFVLGQWDVIDGRFAEQHFATALPVLDDLPRSTILSDPATSAFIAGNTKHDIVYSIYLKNVLMIHNEIAERYCLTQLPVDTDARNIAGHSHLIYPDANGAFYNDPNVRKKEVQMVKAACNKLDSDPAGSLKRYGVDYVLWDMERNPDWQIGRFAVTLEEIASDEGWVLYRSVYEEDIR